MCRDAPREIYATLLDEGHYLYAPRTMYRLLEAAHVILDIFSRYVVGWMVAHAESAPLAERLIAATCETQAIRPGQLTVHADRGSSMTSKAVALLLADLGVTPTPSRPHVSDDNPFSAARFKTLKTRPEFPEPFASAEAARAFCHPFFTWYNTAHHHGGNGRSSTAERRAGRSSPQPLPPIPSASCTGRPNPPRARTPSGSARHPLPWAATENRGRHGLSPPRPASQRRRIDDLEGDRHLDTPKTRPRPSAAPPSPSRLDSKCVPAVSQTR